jgi:hypothetical protein
VRENWLEMQLQQQEEPMLLLWLENDAAAEESVAVTGEADAAAGEAGVAPGVVVINTASPNVAGEAMMTVLSPVVARPLFLVLPPPPFVWMM